MVALSSNQAGGSTAKIHRGVREASQTHLTVQQQVSTASLGKLQKFMVVTWSWLEGRSGVFTILAEMKGLHPPCGG